MARAGERRAGSCPFFCASRISVIERDGVFVARCSLGMRGRGPKHQGPDSCVRSFAARRRGRLAASVASMPEVRCEPREHLLGLLTPHRVQ